MAASLVYKVHPAIGVASSWLQEARGERWLAVGDAAAAYDPLSGIGLTRAIDSGLRTGRALAAALDGDAHATTRYGLEAAHSSRLYGLQRTEIYARERRWPRSPFWARRTSAAGWIPSSPDA